MERVLHPKPMSWLPWVLFGVVIVDGIALAALYSIFLREAGILSSSERLAFVLPIAFVTLGLLACAWNVFQRRVVLTDQALDVRVPWLGERPVRSIPLSQLSRAEVIGVPNPSFPWLEGIAFKLLPINPEETYRRVYLPMGWGKTEPDVVAFAEAINAGIDRAKKL